MSRYSQLYPLLLLLQLPVVFLFFYFFFFGGGCILVIVFMTLEFDAHYGHTVIVYNKLLECCESLYFKA